MLSVVISSASSLPGVAAKLVTASSHNLRRLIGFNLIRSSMSPTYVIILFSRYSTAWRASSSDYFRSSFIVWPVCLLRSFLKKSRQYVPSMILRVRLAIISPDKISSYTLIFILSSSFLVSLKILTLRKCVTMESTLNNCLLYLASFSVTNLSILSVLELVD